VAPRLPDLPAGSLTGDASPPSRAVPLDQAVRDAEAQAIQRALRHAGGNRTTAARILGVSRATLYTKLAEHGIS
jgi:DNA-binding NtrC family response regulator